MATYSSALLASVLLIAGCRPDPNSPFGKGYGFGMRAGESSRNLNSYDLEGAKTRANYVGRISERREGCPYQIGTPEYGNYMNGLEVGYNKAYHR
ncbi:MAG: hypothetical protein M3552_19385 [Planctomycetota bacterium]|nr:hypothetical protein [Planctomycetota bacterium]